MRSKVINKLLILLIINLIVDAFILLGFTLDGHFELIMSYNYLTNLIIANIIICLILLAV